MTKPKAKVDDWTRVDENHAVITLKGGEGGHRNKPCAQCPWRLDATGVFPPEAFVQSAPTAYDAATRTFGCHDSNHDHPQTCAGFLLRGADDNLLVRFRKAEGKIRADLLDEDGLELYDSYRQMAIANGVAEDDPALQLCEPEHGQAELARRTAERKRRREELERGTTE